MKRPAVLCLILVSMLVPEARATVPATPREALDAARTLAAEHRFLEVYETLRPFMSAALEDELAWEIAAETGRAAFHIAHYNEALRILREVVTARPVVLEPALYLGAASFLIGDRAQSLTVLEAVLQAGTIDLYHAVTLPGERAFLADPEVRQLLERYSRPLPVDLELGTCLGLSLGQPRAQVADALGAQPFEDGNLAARAGPMLIWVWSFDDRDTLSEVVLHPDNLRRYTPFRIRINGTIGWDATPADALAALGTPQRSAIGDNDTLTLRFSSAEATLDLVFRRASGGSEEPARLEIARFFRSNPGASPAP